MLFNEIFLFISLFSLFQMPIKSKCNYKKLTPIVFVITFGIFLVSCYIGSFYILSGDDLRASMTGNVFYGVFNALNIISAIAPMSLFIRISHFVYNFYLFSKDEFESSDHDLLKKLKTLRKCHLQLSEACRSCSEYFMIFHTYQLYATIASICMENYTIFVFFNNPSIETFILIPFVFTWVVMTSSYAIIFFIISCIIDQHSFDIRELLDLIRTSKLTKYEQKQIIIFQQMISHQNIKMTCGDLKINKKFIFDFSANIFAVTIMYFQLYRMT